MQVPVKVLLDHGQPVEVNLQGQAAPVELLALFREPGPGALVVRRGIFDASKITIFVHRKVRMEWRCGLEACAGP